MLLFCVFKKGKISPYFAKNTNKWQNNFEKNVKIEDKIVQILQKRSVQIRRSKNYKVLEEIEKGE
jgi:hypothetical protein